jgi:hypothetical protein
VGMQPRDSPHTSRFQQEHHERGARAPACANAGDDGPRACRN